MSRPRRIKDLRTALVGCAAAVLTLVVVSCSSPRAYLTVLRGNYAYDRGNYQQATVDYLDAQKSGTFSQWVAYDLGNVYHALGEPDGASEEWTKAEKATDPNVVALTLFNEGILDYELGKYQDAYDRFKRVLKLTPGDVDAKVNLELSFSKMTTREVPPRTGTQNEPIAVKNANAKVNQVLNIIREKEKGYFVPPPPKKAKQKVPDW